MDELGESYREAQQSVIGAILIDPEPALGAVMDSLAPEHFEGEYRTVFSAIRKLWANRQPVDGVTVLSEVGDGYGAMLRECMKLTPTAANVAAYAGIVRRSARLLALRSAGAALLGAVDEDDARRALEAAEAVLTQRERQRIFPIQQLLGDFYARMDGVKPVYLPWGIRALDEKLTCELGDLVILGADSSVGKTALASQFAWTMAARGYRVGFFSLETRSGKLANRIVAQRGRLDSDVIKRADFQESDYRDVNDLRAMAEKLRLDIVEASGFTPEDVRACTVARGYQVVFVDYLQLLSGEGEGRAEIVANISMALHTMAQDLGVTVVALSQITPASKSKGARETPGKEDLRESRQLIHDADIILMMSLADAEDPTGDRWIRCAKNKEGELPSVCLEFDPKHMDFVATDSRIPRKSKKRPATFREVNTQEEIPWP